MWSVKHETEICHSTDMVDGLPSNDQGSCQLLSSSFMVASIPIFSLLQHIPSPLGNLNYIEAFREGGRVARVALADYAARAIHRLLARQPCLTDGGQSWCDIMSEVPQQICKLTKPLQTSNDASQKRKCCCDWLCYFETLGQSASASRASRHHIIKKTTNQQLNNSFLGGDDMPYILERSDIWCDDEEILHITFRIYHYQATTRKLFKSRNSVLQASLEPGNYCIDEVKNCDCHLNGEKERIRDKQVDKILSDSAIELLFDSGNSLMRHVACAVLQDVIRNQLLSVENMNAVAFIANGSILPRKSGNSHLPMSCPPAIPFMSPSTPALHRTLHVPMGKLSPFVSISKSASVETKIFDDVGDGNVSLSGLLIPRGITLIVGGGYHGKSTILQALATAGVYNVVPGDGREYVITVSDAITVRSEDGRYVHNCNVSAFIANLPTEVDTTAFCTRDASGSTSQAANVCEAIEMGTSAILVDEDLSAANFMARDGRMRALVADESITPLLYRVNGMYESLGISSIVVIGGLGDWLDVPHTVLLIDRYVVSDVTKKAQRVSETFSYGHIQYAGRGVVHRLSWEKKTAPKQRRPFLFRWTNLRVELVNGNGSRLLLVDNDDSVLSQNVDIDEDFGEIDMARCEQLVGRINQLYGCGVCVVWIINEARKYPDLGMKQLLNKMDGAMDSKGGIMAMFLTKHDDDVYLPSAPRLIETIGYSYRPRKYEVAMALTRMRGFKMVDAPLQAEGSHENPGMDAELEKSALLEIWANRRSRKVNW